MARLPQKRPPARSALKTPPDTAPNLNARPKPPLSDFDPLPNPTPERDLRPQSDGRLWMAIVVAVFVVAVIVLVIVWKH